MQLKEFDILIDIKKHNKIDYIEVVQGDFETNILNIKLISGLNNFNLAGASVEIAFSKPDGTTVIQDQANGVAILNESEGKIQCILNTNTIAREGRVIAEVRVFEGTKLLTSSRFEFWVRKAIVNDETIESTNEFPLLQRLTDDVQGIISTESTRVTAEDERKTAETNRKNAENARVAAEQQRATTFAGYETRVSTVEDDLIAHKEDYTQHLNSNMPHKMKIDGIDYKYGLTQEDGFVKFIYEEVV